MKNNLIYNMALGLTCMAASTLSVQAAESFSSSVPGLINDHVLLGTAYHSGKQKFLNHQPVSGSISDKSGNVEFSIETGIDMNYDKILKVLNGNIDIDVNFPVVRVNAGGHIAKETAASSYASSYTFHISTTPKKHVLEPVDPDAGFTLSPVGNDIANNYPLKLHELAGDEFVTSIEYGANMMVNMKIDYLNEQDKSDIGGYLGVDIYGGVVSVDGKLNFLDQNDKKSINITVRAMQNGGDPKQLLKIIPNNIITCTLDNPAPCFDLFNAAINYAKNEFSSQFNDLSDYNVVRYGTTRYDKSSLDLKRLVPEYQEIKFATRYKIIELEDGFKESVVDEQRAADLITKYYSWMPESQRGYVEQIQAAAYNNAWLYYDAARYCRNRPYGDLCLDYWAQIENNCQLTGEGCIVSYTETQLSIPTQEAKRWFKCENARQAATDHGLETEANSISYRKLRWAPVFVDNNTPTDGIIEWAPCDFALTTYGDYFAD